VVALAGLAPQTFVAHGGVAGAIVETLLAVGVAALFFAVWLRERRAGRSDDQDQIKPQ
jgi:2-keto-3-deoxy-6-phosphogluconate aldolase